jgi:hypothetical protein
MPNERKEYPERLLFLPCNGAVIPIKLKLGDHDFCHCKYEGKLKNIFNDNLLHLEEDENED